MINENGLKVTYEDFINMDFRVGEILECEEVRKSNTLVKFQVSVGDQVLQIMSGIKGIVDPETLIGKKVMVLTNLAPTTLGGMTTEGIICIAEDDTGKLSFMVPEEEVSVGAEIC